MPKPRRRSSVGRAPDDLPAFARPPGAKRVSRHSSPEKDDIETAPRRKTAKARQSPATTPVRKSKHGTPIKGSRESTPTKARYHSGTSVGESSNPLSIDSLAKLNAINEKYDAKQKDVHRRKEKNRDRVYKADNTGARHKRRRSSRYANAALLEEGITEKHRRRESEIRDEKARLMRRGGAGGGGGGGDYDDEDDYERRRKRKKLFLLLAAFLLLLLIILIPVGVLVVGKHHNSSSSGSSTSTSTSKSSNLPDESTIPAAAKGTVLDPYTWLDTTDFNTTYTNETVGGIPIMGLNMTWDDTAQANPYVPALNKNWTYGERPIRGVNLGGWLSIEPFITPSFFNKYSASDGIVDEYTLVTRLGATLAAQTLEKHYSTWVTEQTFAEIADAGLDHVRIQYSYWAITTYDGDPYVPKISWRYLLRGIEWARKYGLRINLDLHALPGSQNGMNHSGRQGTIGWLNGTDGTLNSQRSLDLHAQLAKFFSQDRYKNIITLYGLVNEPKMMSLPTATVVSWNEQAISVVRKNGYDNYITFGDGFLALTSWKGQMQNVDSKLIMDTHQYMIFNTEEIAYTHKTKVDMACQGWTTLLTTSLDTSTGWGPLLCGEWTQADTDCTPYLNGINVGNRWTGTIDGSGVPDCPANNTCSCSGANADPSDYVDEYRSYLKMLGEAQMNTFEKTWGWFYWTWWTESAPQWSWKQGAAAGILPAKAYAPSFTCNTTVPDFETLGLSETY